MRSIKVEMRSPIFIAVVVADDASAPRLGFRAQPIDDGLALLTLRAVVAPGIRMRYYSEYLDGSCAGRTGASSASAWGASRASAFAVDTRYASSRSGVHRAKCGRSRPIR